LTLIFLSFISDDPPYTELKSDAAKLVVTWR